MPKTSRSLISWPWFFLKGLILTMTVVVALIIVNLSYILTSPFYILYRPFYRLMAREVPYAFWSYAMFVAEQFLPYSINLEAKSIPFKENALILSNHQTGADILGLSALAKRGGMLGDIKYMAKDILKWIPILGGGMLYIGCIMIKRNWTRDASTIQKAFNHIMSERLPLWFTIFPEGTRFTEEKLKKAQQYAHQKDCFVPQKTLIPKTKGVWASLKGMEGHIQAVYDVTIFYPGGIPSLADYFLTQGTSPQIFFQRFPIEEVPTEERALNEWLRELYQQKDLHLQQLEKDYRNRP